MHALAAAAVAAVVAAGAMAQSSPPVTAGAFHAPYGVGCHDLPRESVYWSFADAANAALALPGRCLTLAPTAGGYTATWGNGGFHAPSSAAIALPPSDDGQVAVSLPQALPVPGGAVAMLWVHSNGIVALGPSIDGGAWNTPPNDFTPSPSFRNAPDTAFFAWHDWNPAEPGSGRIVTETASIAGEPVFCITWRDVENFPAGVVNRGTFQFRFHLATGRVVYSWLAVDPATASPFGTAHLVGYSPGGPSLDPGPSPTGASWSGAVDSYALSLAASPPPISTPTVGTDVRWSLANAPAVVVGSTVRLGFLVLSFAPAPGIELAAFGAPGCALYVASADLSFLVGGTSPDLSLDVAFPAGLPSGLEVFAQALALLPPQPFGTDVNTLGLVTSNGVVSHVGSH